MPRFAFIPASVFSGVETCRIGGFTAASSIAGTYSPSRRILAGRDIESVAVARRSRNPRAPRRPHDGDEQGPPILNPKSSRSLAAAWQGRGNRHFWVERFGHADATN